MQPAFVHTYEYVKGHKLGLIRLNPVVASRMGADRLPAVISPKHLPMLVEPRPWTATDVGGYLRHRGRSTWQSM
jgi:DNA-directed RNA polymerase